MRIVSVGKIISVNGYFVLEGVEIDAQDEAIDMEAVTQVLSEALAVGIAVRTGEKFGTSKI